MERKAFGLAILLIQISTAAFGAIKFTDVRPRPDPTGIKDSSPALRAALRLLHRQGGGVLLVPPGKYAIRTPVREDFGARNNSSIVIRGESSQSQFVIQLTDTSGTAIAFQNLGSVVLEDLTFVGGSARTDAWVTLSLEWCIQAIIQRCHFYGIGSMDEDGGAIIRAEITDLRIENSGFRGCAAHPRNPIVDNVQWRGLSVVNTDFIDFGYLNGRNYSKTPISQAASWIHVGKPTQVGADGQNVVILRGVRMDEGALWGFVAQPGSPRIAHIYLSGLRVNGWNGEDYIGGGVLINHADRVQIENSWFGFTSKPKYAIQLGQVTSAVLSGIKTSPNPNLGMTIIRADSVQGLTIIDSEYSHLESRATITNIVKNGRHSLAVPVAAKDASYTVTLDDNTIIATKPLSIITLPRSAEMMGRSYTVKNASGGKVTVASESRIDGVVEKVLGSDASITVRSDGKTWYVIGLTGSVF